MSIEEPQEAFLITTDETVLFPQTVIPLVLQNPSNQKTIELAKEMGIPVGICPKKLILKARLLPFFSFKCGVGPSSTWQKQTKNGLFMTVKCQKRMLIKKIKKIDSCFFASGHIADFTDLDRQNLFKINRLKKDLFKYFEKKNASAPFIEYLKQNTKAPEQVIGQFSNLLITDSHKKQKVLEIDDLNEKLDYILKTI